MTAEARSSERVGSPQPTRVHESSGKITLPPQRRAPKGPREIRENARTARRFIQTVSRKISDHGDPEDLAELLVLDRTLHNAMHIAISGLRRNGRSDAEIARVLGITRQAVSQRFPR